MHVYEYVMNALIALPYPIAVQYCVKTRCNCIHSSLHAALLQSHMALLNSASAL
jgi:hypothetical protein